MRVYQFRQFRWLFINLAHDLLLCSKYFDLSSREVRDEGEGRGRGTRERERDEGGGEGESGRGGDFPLPVSPFPDTRHPTPDTRHPTPDTLAKRKLFELLKVTQAADFPKGSGRAKFGNLNFL